MSAVWEQVGGDTSGTVAGLAATAQSWLFAATPVGVYRSTDGGRTWRLPGVGSGVPFADAVLASPRFEQDQTLFACAADGLYRSSDAGESWQRVLVGSRMLSVAAVQAERLLVLAGTEQDGILRSEDSGRSWVGANAGLLDLTAICLALSPCFERDRTGFAGTASGMYRTRNAGRSWRALECGLDDVAVQCLAVSPDFATDQLVLAGTEADGLLRSTDGGISWHRPAALLGSGIAALAFTEDGRTIAAGTDSGVAISRDGGETWTEASPGVPVLSLALMDGSVLAGVHRGGLLRSDDGGASWQRADAGLSARLDTEVVLSPDFANDRTIFVTGVEDGPRVSRDGGATWEEDLAGGALSAMAASATGTPARVVAEGPGVALAAVEGGRLLASDDTGRTWRDLSTPWGGVDVVALAVSPSFSQDRTLFAACADATESVLWRSLDGGGRWQRWLVQPGAAVGRLPLVMAPTYAIDGNVFVGHAGRVLRPLRHMEEVRRGERRPTWRSASLGVSSVSITGLAVSPAYAEDRTVFAATNVGAFVSRNSGESFEDWNEGHDQPRLVSIAASPNYAQDRLVYALALGGTLWRRRDVTSF